MDFQLARNILASQPGQALDRRPIIERLDAYYTPSEALKWCSLPHPQLGGETVTSAIAQGRVDEVHAILDRLDSDAYL